MQKLSKIHFINNVRILHKFPTLRLSANIEQVYRQSIVARISNWLIEQVYRHPFSNNMCIPSLKNDVGFDAIKWFFSGSHFGPQCGRIHQRSCIGGIERTINHWEPSMVNKLEGMKHPIQIPKLRFSWPLSLSSVTCQSARQVLYRCAV